MVSFAPAYKTIFDDYATRLYDALPHAIRMYSNDIDWETGRITPAISTPLISESQLTESFAIHLENTITIDKNKNAEILHNFVERATLHLFNEALRGYDLRHPEQRRSCAEFSFDPTCFENPAAFERCLDARINELTNFLKLTKNATEHDDLPISAHQITDLLFHTSNGLKPAPTEDPNNPPSNRL